MLCKWCGGEVNLSVGRCIRCGRAIDETADIRIVHDIETLAKNYNINIDADAPENADDRYDTVAKVTGVSPVIDVKTAKKPKIELSTYLELLGEKKAEDDAEDMEQTDDREDEATPEDETPQERDGFVSVLLGKTDVLAEKTKSFLGRSAKKLDGVTSPFIEKIRKWYHTKVPELNRAQSSPVWERLAIIGVLLGAVALVVTVVVLIISAIPESVKGEWRISPDGAQSMFTVDFQPNGEVVAYAYTDGTAHVYMRGEYSTDRSNGHDLLTIIYEDGSESHLYYELHGETGVFTNVDSNRSDTYVRMDD